MANSEIKAYTAKYGKGCSAFQKAPISTLISNTSLINKRSMNLAIDEGTRIGQAVRIQRKIFIEYANMVTIFSLNSLGFLLDTLQVTTPLIPKIVIDPAMIVIISAT